MDGTNYLDTVSAFIEGFLHLLAGEGVWGRGRHLSPRPQQPLRKLFVVLFVHKNLDRRASIFGLAFGLALEFFRRAIGQRRMQALLIVNSSMNSSMLVRKCQVLVFVSVDFFSLQCLDEAFATGVVIGFAGGLRSSHAPRRMRVCSSIRTLSCSATQGGGSTKTSRSTFRDR